MNRLKRERYGPYTLELVPNPNDLQEVSVSQDLKRLMYEYYKTRAQQASQKIQDTKAEKEVLDEKKTLKEIKRQ